MVLEKSSTGKVRAASATSSATSSPASIVVTFLPTLYVCGLLFAQGARAQQSGLPLHSVCGQTRSVLVRFLDARPASGVKVLLTAASPDMGGPELYVKASPPAPPAPGGGQTVVISPLSTPDMNCTSVITGTLTASTDQRGLARFDRLGEGAWLLYFEGEVTYEGLVAPIVPASIQGRFPQGRTRAGGGFIEQVTPLNEEGGPTGQPVQSGTGPTTSRYLLAFSAGQGVWLPGLDLAAADDEPPVPLAGMTPVEPVAPMTTPVPETPTMPSAVVTQGVSQSSRAGNGTNSSAQESTFDASSAEVVPGSSQLAPQSTGPKDNTHQFSAWWAAVLGLTVGGVAVLMWARRHASERNGAADTGEPVRAGNRRRRG